MGDHHVMAGTGVSNQVVVGVLQEGGDGGRLVPGAVAQVLVACKLGTTAASASRKKAAGRSLAQVARSSSTASSSMATLSMLKTVPAWWA